MKILEQTIQHLSDDERQNFRNSLITDRESSKYLKLFDVLSKQQGGVTDALWRKLYPNGGLNAYHSLRKRLMKKLVEFQVLYHLQTAPGGATGIGGMITFCELMLERHNIVVAGYYLKQTELLAVKNESAEMLDTIYKIRIKYAEELKTDLEKVYKLWDNNNKEYIQRQRLVLAYALIRKEYEKARKQGIIINYEKTVDKAFKKFDVSIREENNAAFMHRVVSLTRKGAVTRKDYTTFSQDILRTYHKLKDANAFEKDEAIYELGFLYMIAHASYRNRQFEEASTWVESMGRMFKIPKFKLSPYYAKYISLSAAIASYSGHNTEAIDIMKKALSAGDLKIPLEERLNMELNLAVYYFQAENYKMANKTIIDIGHTDGWLENRMGKEWRFKKNMIEIIIQCELGNEDIALTKIKAVEKLYKKFLSQKTYSRAHIFLRFIKRVITDPMAVTSKEFAEQVKQANMGLPEDREDIQAITFFCWLKSKMLRRKYYAVLLEVIKAPVT